MIGRSRPAFVAIGATLAATLLASACTSQRAAPTHDFTLTDQTGQRFELASLRGRVVLVFFGYSNCPDVCPTTLSKLTTVAERLGEQRDAMKVVYVTVDPERDTPEVLRADLANFALDAVGLTGTREEVDRAVQLFGAKYEIVPTPESAARYTVSHSTTLYVLDQQGQLTAEFPYEAQVDEIVTTVRALFPP